MSSKFHIPDSTMEAQAVRKEQGEAFARWLNDVGYSPTEFAKRCDIYVRRVHSWIAGERRLPLLMPVLLDLLAKEKKNG